jgi:hypothetical protein
MKYKQFNISIPVKSSAVVLIDGLGQYDTANVVTVRLMEGTEPLDFTGYTDVILEILKPDGKMVHACSTEIESEVANPYLIQALDPERGIIQFTLKGQATVCPGTHFAQLIIMGDGQRLSSARINYYVGETMLQELPELTSSNDYASFVAWIAQNSAIAASEADRVRAEDARVNNFEQLRADYAELKQGITDYLENARNYVYKCEELLAQTKRFADMARKPNEEIITEAIADLNLATIEFVETAIQNATQSFDAGWFEDDEPDKGLSILKGGEDNMPELDVGELAFATDGETLYIGTIGGNKPLTGSHHVGSTAPDRTDVAWIDTSEGAVLKYYDGTTWQPAAVAVFA